MNYDALLQPILIINSNTLWDECSFKFDIGVGPTSMEELLILGEYSNQMIDFYMKRNTELKWVKKLSLMKCAFHFFQSQIHIQHVFMRAVFEIIIGFKVRVSYFQN